jgi:ubiquinone/menaquinone biosynthesis C-methylase UbiE
MFKPDLPKTAFGTILCNLHYLNHKSTFPAMSISSIHRLLGNTDIYLVDQILKNRYAASDRILDAGCGRGRNLQWFLAQDMEVYASDRDPETISNLLLDHPTLKKDRVQCCPVETMPYDDNFFDHIISSAVLHFAENEDHFLGMIAEMVRVLKPGGSLFIRMTTDRSIENRTQPLGQGVYLIPDGSTRFLLTDALLQKVLHRFNLSLAEPFKFVNVEDLRAMCTLLLVKTRPETAFD